MTDSIDSVLQERRLFPPPREFAADALLSDPTEYERLYRQSIDDPEAFWGEAAKELHWFEPFRQVLDWQEPHAKWFVGGKMNLAYNCLDLQVERGLANKVAFYWEGEPGDRRVITFGDLLVEVSRLANVLKAEGIGSGDVVAI